MKDETKRESKGMETRITEAQERVGRDGSLDCREEITIRLLIKDAEHSYPAIHEQPSLTLYPDKYKEVIDLHRSTIAPRRGGMSGSIGTVKLEQITAETLEEKVLALVREVLK